MKIEEDEGDGERKRGGDGDLGRDCLGMYREGIAETYLWSLG